MSDGGEDAEERQGGGKETGEGVGAGGEGGNADMSIDGADGAEEQSESRGGGGADAGDDLEKAVFGSSGACLPPARSEIKGWEFYEMLVSFGTAVWANGDLESWSKLFSPDIYNTIQMREDVLLHIRYELLVDLIVLVRLLTVTKHLRITLSLASRLRGRG